MKYDIVGDVHGYADRFITLLSKLGYTCINGLWQHPERILLSLGDIIDRGPGQKEIVDILKNMQENGKAIVLMGNHEFYAIAWHLKDADGKPLREHSDKNRSEHQAFLTQAVEGSEWYETSIAWFRTLPLFFESHELRCVHAAWDNKHIQTVQQYTDENGVLRSSFWNSIPHIDINYFKALEYCLNGSKLKLPDGYSFIDSGGRERKKARLKWWDVPLNATYRNACTSVPDLSELPNYPISLDLLPNITGKQPIFFGHYWMQGNPKLMKPNIACLDWSVVIENGVLAAYRFDGEQILDAKKLVWV